MTNFIFKSPRRLVKKLANIPEELLVFKLELIQKELRNQRQDNKDIMLMINKLLVDKHLQMQVDNYFDKDEDETSPQTDSEEHFKDEPGDFKVGI